MPLAFVDGLNFSEIFFGLLNAIVNAGPSPFRHIEISSFAEMGEKVDRTEKKAGDGYEDKSASYENKNVIFDAALGLFCLKAGPGAELCGHEHRSYEPNGIHIPRLVFS
jgi:hypothetical protein